MEQDEVLVRISSAGTISIPKSYRRYMDLQRGDYVRVIAQKDHLVIRKAIIS